MNNGDLKYGVSWISTYSWYTRAYPRLNALYIWLRSFGKIVRGDRLTGGINFDDAFHPTNRHRSDNEFSFEQFDIPKRNDRLKNFYNEIRHLSMVGI